MQQMSTTWLASMTAPSRIVEGKAELYKDSALSNTFLPTGNLVSIKLERTVEDGGIFGYSISQKATIEVIDKDNNISIEKGDGLKAYLGNETELAKNPIFYVEEFKRDEITNNISIVAYDAINKSSSLLYKDLNITYPITIIGIAEKVAEALGVEIVWSLVSDFPTVDYTEEAPPGLGGNETLRQVINAIAQATGTICYMNSDNQLCFKHLKGEPAASIGKESYFELKMGEPLTLTRVSHANNLGDANTTMGTDEGFHYIMRENPFVGSGAADPMDILTYVLNSFVGVSFYPYDLKWRGNPAFEIGDKITITQKDDTTVDVFYLGETLNYTGGMTATSSWTRPEQDQVEATPVSLGNALLQTFTKVDKVNNKIQLVAAQSDANADNIGTLLIDTESITASIEEVNKNFNASIEALEGEMAVLSEGVSASLTKDDLTIEIQNVLSDGVNKVETTTGYKFDEDGLNITKSGSEISTQITEDGMTVSRSEEVVLTVNSEGVQAEDLHATTYLIIGNNSRFEDFIDDKGVSRTGCFWIGG